MDRLLEALKRLADEPAPAAVERIVESELREVERLSPRSTRSLVGTAATASPFANLSDDSSFYSPDEVILEANLQEFNLQEAACVPWVDLQDNSDSELSETWESDELQIDTLAVTDPSGLIEELDATDDLNLEECDEQPGPVDESLTEENSQLVDFEDALTETPSPLSEEAQEGQSTLDSEVEQKPSEEETLEEIDEPQPVQPGWEWVEEPYLELLSRITEHQSQGISHAVAITSVDDLPDREMVVAGLAKAYAVTTGERVLVVSATRHAGHIVEQLGVMVGQKTKSHTPSASVDIEKVVPTRHSQADFLNLEDLFPSDDSSSLPAVDPMLVTKWRGHYSLILLDTGPWGESAVFPLARQCDATYVVLGLGVTHQETALDAITRMKRGGIRVAGCVLTGSQSGDLL